jgi:hypothetical protein
MSMTPPSKLTPPVGDRPAGRRRARPRPSALLRGREEGARESRLRGGESPRTGSSRRPRPRRVAPGTSPAVAKGGARRHAVTHRAGAGARDRAVAAVVGRTRVGPQGAATRRSAARVSRTAREVCALPASVGPPAPAISPEGSIPERTAQPAAPARARPASRSVEPRGSRPRPGSSRRRRCSSGAPRSRCPERMRSRSAKGCGGRPHPRRTAPSLRRRSGQAPSARGRPLRGARASWRAARASSGVLPSLCCAAPKVAAVTN